MFSCASAVEALLAERALAREIELRGDGSSSGRGGPMVAALISAALAAAPAQEALSKLQSLAGDWQGSYRWTGARTDAGKVTARYSLTGGGSAVVEDLTMGPASVPSMTSVYHLDGPDLRLTHYCAARNQPRLKAREIDLAGGALAFDFVDATNLASPEAPHVAGREV